MYTSQIFLIQHTDNGRTRLASARLRPRVRAAVPARLRAANCYCCPGPHHGFPTVHGPSARSCPSPDARAGAASALLRSSRTASLMRLCSAAPLRGRPRVRSWPGRLRRCPLARRAPAARLRAPGRAGPLAPTPAALRGRRLGPRARSAAAGCPGAFVPTRRSGSRGCARAGCWLAGPPPSRHLWLRPCAGPYPRRGAASSFAHGLRARPTAGSRAAAEPHAGLALSCADPRSGAPRRLAAAGSGSCLDPSG
ncbi:hypothetical protein VPH35_096266 [Triticum aestivum]